MNEGVIKFKTVTTGLATVTASIRKPDDTIRDSQTAIALVDTGHAGLYTNSGAVTIQAGDTIEVAIDGAGQDAGEYRPETRAVALLTTIAGNITADTAFDITDGPAIADILINMVVMITDVSSGFSVTRRITAYTAGKNVTLDTDAKFSLAAGDVITIWGDSYEGELGSVAAAQVADAVWDENMSEHNISESAGDFQKRNANRF